MEVLGLQFDIVWENKPANYAKARSLLAAARPSRGALVVLPEMFATGFSMNVAGIAEPAGGPTERFLAATAREFGVTLLGGVVRPGDSGKGRNEAVAFSPAGVELARYAKLHCFTPAGEGEHYEPGRQLALFAAGSARVAPFICYDLRFPEVFRAAALQRPEVLAILANWPAVRLEHWLTLLRARAIENQAYVVGVNRCGATPKLEYAGRSLIVDPQGRVLADGGAGEGQVRAALDLPGLERYRREFPILPDLRRDFVPHP